MPTPDPQLLTTFSAIVGAGSISAAAVRLGCGKSVVSRQLTRLGGGLGARLVQRPPPRLAAAIKALPLSLVAPRPLDEAISSAGGVRFEALDAGLMIRAAPVRSTMVEAACCSAGPASR